MYSDADWGNDVIDRKLISGYATFVFGNPVCWSFKKKTLVATSCESEYIALSEPSKKVSG